METVTPPVKKVTTPEPETAEVSVVASQQPTKNKDPKKVEAGRAGAAARKAKQEKMLEELRTAKEALQQPPVTKSQGHSQCRVVEDTDNAVAQSAGASTTDWTPWFIGGGLVGAICIYTYLFYRTLPQASSKPPTQVSTAQRDPSNQPIEAWTDPFYME